jgi:hypothetical protein
MAEAPRDRAAVQQQESEAQRVSRALAEAQMEAERRQADEFPKEGGKQTDSGMMFGKFMVDGRLVYADGTPVKDKQD